MASKFEKIRDLLCAREFDACALGAIAQSAILRELVKTNVQYIYPMDEEEEILDRLDYKYRISAIFEMVSNSNCKFSASDDFIVLNRNLENKLVIESWSKNDVYDFLLCFEESTLATYAILEHDDLGSTQISDILESDMKDFPWSR